MKHLISWWKTNIGEDELAGIKQAIDSRCISQGELTEELEKRLSKLLDVPYVMLTTNGSSALLAALIACGIKAGDEVIVPDLTFIATAQAPLLLGAKIKLADVECKRPVIDVKSIESLITSKTRAVIPVHLNGRAADIERINRLAARHGFKVIEDATQALCSRGTAGYLGTWSHMGVFSLGMTKLINTGQGGFVATRDKDMFKKLKKIRNYGASSLSSDPMDYDTFGFNFKFNDILAAMGLGQVKKLKEKIKAHKYVYNFYKQELKNLDYIKIIEVDVENGEFPLWVETLCAERDKVVGLLKEKNIQARPFDPCLSQIPYLKSKKTFKHSRIYAGSGLVLPCGPDQDTADLKLTVKALKEIKKKIKTRLQYRI